MSTVKINHEKVENTTAKVKSQLEQISSETENACNQMIQRIKNYDGEEKGAIVSVVSELSRVSSEFCRTTEELSEGIYKASEEFKMIDSQLGSKFSKEE